MRNTSTKLAAARRVGTSGVVGELVVFVTSWSEKQEAGAQLLGHGRDKSIPNSPASSTSPDFDRT